MANTSNLRKTEGGLFLFKGPPKEGKSIAAHSFPNSYTFDFDDKIRTVANYYSNRSFDYDVFPDPIEVRRKIESFKTNCPYDTIIVDGVTEAANFIMRCMIQYRSPNWKEASLTRAGNKDKTIRAGVPMTEIEDFNGESKFLGDLVDELKAVRLIHPHVNIIFTAHVLTFEVYNMKGQVESTTKRLVTWGNKIGVSLPGKFEEVLAFDRQTSLDDSPPRFICYSEDHNGNGAGNSLGLPGIIDWTGEDFYQKIQKYIRKDIL